MCNDFLRPRENSWKWFNVLGVVRRRLYILRGDKSAFSHKNNMVNRFTKWVNRFREHKNKLKTHEGWYYLVHWWIDSRKPRMKYDAIQPFVKSIQCKTKTFMIRFKWWLIDSHVMRFRKWWIISSGVRDFDDTIQAMLNWFNRWKDEHWHIFKVSE